MKTLKTIQMLSKIGRIVSIVLFIFCIIGIVGTVIGIISVAALIAVGNGSFEIGDTVVKLIGDEISKEDMPNSTMIAAMAVGAVILVGMAVLCRMAKNYFTNELADGTPFTFRGAAELQRLGIASIIVSVVTSFIAFGGLEIASLFVSDIDKSKLDANVGSSIGTGLIIILISLLCRLGAETAEAKAAPAAESAPEAEAAPAAEAAPEAEAAPAAEAAPEAEAAPAAEEAPHEV